MARQMSLIPVDHAVVEGLEMGVLPDGTPYLAGRALARLCGIAGSTISELADAFVEGADTKRIRTIQGLLDAQGYKGATLYVEIEVKGRRQNAHPDAVCMALLEYYAFELSKEEALKNYRILARLSLRQFIYGRLGYDPLRPTRESLGRHYERVVINAVPAGFYSVFIESSDLAMNAIRAGLVVDSHTVPDISIGQAWAKEWKSNNMDARFGERRQHPHKFPPDPQAQANFDAWIYPLGSLGEFKLWLQQVYMPEKLPSYLSGKVSTGALTAARAEELINAMVGLPAPAPRG